MVASVGRGMVAGLAGTAVMTAYQLLVEMPLTGRDESQAPARFARKVLPIRAPRRRRRRALNYGAHFAIGATWGVAHSLVARAGLRGQRAVGVVFGGLYVGDAVLNTALGLYHPTRWSARDWAIDLSGKLVLAEATGLIYERLDASER